MWIRNLGVFLIERRPSALGMEPGAFLMLAFEIL
jgi:hypothetical protein